MIVHRLIDRLTADGWTLSSLPELPLPRYKRMWRFLLGPRRWWPSCGLSPLASLFSTLRVLPWTHLGWGPISELACSTRPVELDPALSYLISSQSLNLPCPRFPRLASATPLFFWGSPLAYQKHCISSPRRYSHPTHPTPLGTFA